MTLTPIPTPSLPLPPTPNPALPLTPALTLALISKPSPDQVAFIASTVSAVKIGMKDYEDESGADIEHSLLAIFEEEWERLLVGIPLP